MARAASHRVSRVWVAGALIAVVTALGAVLWAPGQPAVPPSAAAAGDRLGAGAVVDPSASSQATAIRDRVPQAEAAGSTVLCGTVSIAETKAPAAGGSIVAEFIDCDADGIDPVSLVDRDPEGLRQDATRRTCVLDEGGTYGIAIPRRAFLIAFAIEPADEVAVPGLRDEVRIGAFERRDVVVCETATGAERRQDFEVGLGGRLTGFVVDHVGGTPVPSALVRCETWCGQYGARSDSRGAFEVTGLPSQTESEDEQWEVRVSCPGFHERDLQVRPAAPAPTQLVIELERAVLVRGRVVDPQGRVVASVEVGAVAPSLEPTPLGQSLELVQSTETDVDGSFSFSIAPVASLSLRAEGSYLQSSTPESWAWGVGVLAGVAVTRDIADLRVELQPMASFRVLAIRPDGTPAPEDDLVVLLKTADGWRRCRATFTAAPAVVHEIWVFAPASARGSDGAGRSGAVCRTALRGRTTCLAANPGTLVEVRVPLEPWELEIPPPPMPKAEGERLFTLGSNVPGPHARFVRDLSFVDVATGQPLAERRFELRFGGGGISSGTTSSCGRVRLELGPGLVDLMISVQGCRPRGFRVDNPATGYEEVELRFHALRPVGPDKDSRKGR